MSIAAIRAASRQMVRELGMLDSRIGCLDMSGAQAHALMEIEASGSLTSGELSQRLNLDPSTISRTVARVIERGWVTADEGDDRRSKPLMLSPAGRDKLEQLHRFADGQVSEALALLTPSDQQLVVQGLETYSRALSLARRQREFTIRPIEARDDAAVARIIRTVLVAFGVTGPGSALYDPEVDSMTAAYSEPGSEYFVLERGGKVVGGAGYGPLANGDGTVAEVRKMYFLPEVRGFGMGRRMLARVLDGARGAGYREMYLETVARMTAARSLYESMGFRQLDSAQGCTGHTACEIWYGLTF
ncbi:bifunctional helix-turn-helix transcriptional regulator/GNAT family N-acetyltransferase [Fimbriimonas ginsengisoli]|uniref:Acetyltransferase, GNAT family n=1 Tax=Fimbriimonas ginsengisoli Gsoil 348 TaxID=661478 RepID=A0A068NPD0_FIMGI|nr:bifunctional helix-turn-helix transcriptional regulator/GNAT family N-acetyltransferase [Fimbriimonas ginsengisoli]AIE85311.1 acetyltransferase, GNAT family [Fimbriimonas ginsengisoli Gsoil 348]